MYASCLLDSMEHSKDLEWGMHQQVSDVAISLRLDALHGLCNDNKFR